MLEGAGRTAIAGETHPLGAGTSVFVSGGTAWSAEGSGRAVSVLVHDPAPSTPTHAVLDLTAAEKGSATAGRQFVLGATARDRLRLGHTVHRPRPAGPRTRITSIPTTR